jgi:hypothetical protein
MIIWEEFLEVAEYHNLQRATENEHQPAAAAEPFDIRSTDWCQNAMHWS